ncbi:MAG: pseudouridine synthase [Coriobacteriia bacterium]|nr:pseudouridine synthase [Coriobacteriia bacterium]
MGPAEDGPMRLQRFLARAGVASRRASEELIADGRVTVNGEPVAKMGVKVDLDHDVVRVDGQVVSISQEHVALVLHKPAGYVTTMSDPQGRPCVADLVPVEQYAGLYPVGRLDRDTTGLLLFVTDGGLGNQLLHPSHHVLKQYLATVRGVPSRHQVHLLRTGVKLDDGMTSPAEVELLDNGPDATLRIGIREGRNRQVRRMCDAVGHECLHLHRSHFGPLDLEGLPEGQWRLLSEDELAQLRAAAGLA